MKKRIASTFGLWAMIIAVLTLFGPWGGVLLLATLAALTQLELYTLLGKMGDYRPLKITGTALGLILIIGSYLFNEAGALELFAIAIVGLSLTLIAKPELKRTFLPTLFGVVYVPFMLAFYALLMRDYGALPVPVMIPVWIIAVAKFSDVGGLLVGSQIGKHKLCPHISPGKTIEGGLGGVAMSAIVGVILLAVLPDLFPESLTFLKAALIAAVIGALALASDLIESIIKRQAGVKDSGKAIPGIGGIFDLTDSLILTAPIGYILFKNFV